MSRRRYVPWTDAEVAFVRQARANGTLVPDIAAALNRPVCSIHNVIQRHRIGKREGAMPPDAALPPPPAPPEPVDPVEQEQARQARLAALKEERDALKDVAGERSLRVTLEQIIGDVVPRFPAPPPYRATNGKGTIGETAESLILCLSDWHYGEEVLAERTRGFNAYDVDIAEARARRVFASVTSIVRRMQRGGYRFNRVVASVNGDMLTGTIHDLERHSGGANIVQSTYGCAMLLAELLRDFAAVVPALDVYVTAGNHTRMAPKMESKDPMRTWDAVLGLFVKTALAGCPTITVTVPNAYGCAFELEGHTFVQTHGHQIKGGSFGGLPWYGISRMVTNYNALEASRGGHVTGWLLGHFHQASSIPNVSSEIFVNGSLIAGTEWTVDTLGKNDRPCQWLLGVHPEFGVTHRWPIYAEAPPVPAASAAA